MDQLSSKYGDLWSDRGHSASGGRGYSAGSGHRTASTTRPGKAVQIVDFQRDNRAVLNEREVGRIIKEDLPTVVVSIGGVARSGKSFLLNLLVNLLTYMERNGTVEGWESSNEPVQGVNWAQSRKAVTLGIWMWNKQFVIRRRDGKKVSVVLVDSQGTGDNRRSDVKLDTLIMYISLQLSTFQLLNIANYLTSNELTSLQLCTDYADIDKDAGSETSNTSGHLFESLVFVVRNCNYTQKFGEDPTLFKEIKEENVNADITRAVEGIERAFKHITSFAFPYPGESIAGASEKQKEWTLQDVPQTFLKAVRDLAVVLFASEEMSVETLPTGSQIQDKFQALKMRLEARDLPEIGNPADALKETILYQAYTKALKFYRETIKEVEINLLMNKSEAELRTTLGSTKGLALEIFGAEGHQHKYGRTTIWSKYEDLFLSGCEEQEKVLIVKYNQDKKIADLERNNQEVRRKLEQQAIENVKNISKLENEAKQTQIRLEESKKSSEKREQANRAHLEKITEEMKTAREEDRAYYERESERYRESIKQEQEARNRADDMYSDKMDGLNETIQRMNEEMRKRESETENRIQALQRELQKERNRPPPPRPKGPCSIM